MHLLAFGTQATRIMSAIFHGCQLLCRFQDCLVDKIASSVLQKLPAKPIQAADHPVDMEHRMQPVLQELDRQGVVGLYGMGGVGKTTIANAIYNRLRRDFHSASCYVEVGQDPSIDQLQQRILDTLCGAFPTSKGNVENQAQMKHRLQKQSVLLVLDDIWKKEHLGALLVPVHRDSRVIVTSRKEALLTACMPKLCGRQPAYLKVDFLSEVSSLQLFCRHAFPSQQGSAPFRWDGPSRQAAAACGGLPLSLTVIGSYLEGKVQPEEWEDALGRLQTAQSLEGDNDDRVFSTLKISFDDLGRAEKDMFMDVACVLLGQSSEAAVFAWEDSLGLRNLKSRSLVSVDESGRLCMHDQLRDMGRYFIPEKEPTYCKRYTWEPEVCISLFQHLAC